MRKLNHVVICIDASSSMNGLRQEVVSAFNGLLETLQERSRVEKQDTYMSIVEFAYMAKVIAQPRPVHEIKPIGLDTYHPHGQTALFDGVGRAVTLMDTQGYTNNDDVSFLIVVITDGHENHSTTWNAQKIKKLIADKQATNEWTFAFNVPPGYRDNFVRVFGIPEENVNEWEATVAGTHEMRGQTQSAFVGYFDDRSKGVKATRSFYKKVTTDLSTVDTQKVKASLDDLSNRFRTYTVEKEAPVAEFILVKTGRPYIIGSTYYQLMKSEKIQPSKAVLIVEKGKKAVWGGPDARKLIGLPLTDHARVTPGNHSNYDIYVQSTSLNRKLPRGTKVMVDTLQVQNLAATWMPDPSKATTP